jgi:glycosyltransferase involved in cell wall biosynthesis
LCAGTGRLNQPHTPSPFFSIIVPTYNRPEQLASCLQALTHLTYPSDRFELVVVDDGSTSPPPAIVDVLRNRLDLKFVTQAHAGPGAARNTGAMSAHGQFLAFIGDDCTPAPDWLKILAARFAQTPDSGIGGTVLNALPDSSYSTATHLLLDYMYSHYNLDPEQGCFFTPNNLALPADHFRSLGGFDASFVTGEDRDFCDRWLGCGYRMIYAPEVIVHHSHALTLRGFWCQHFNYGRGSWRYHLALARRNAGRVKLEPLKFYLSLIWYPLSRSQGGRRFWLALLLVLSQVANAAGFFWEWLNQSDR